MTVVHQRIGPFYACKYVGDNPLRRRNPRLRDDVDVVVWLLYEPEPPVPQPDDPWMVDWMVRGVLYNRRRNQHQIRDDRWVARAHGLGHHHHSPAPERHFRGRTQEIAVEQLWLYLHRLAAPTAAAYTAAVAAAQATFHQPGSSCG